MTQFVLKMTIWYERNRHQGHYCIWRISLAKTPIYTERTFRRRYRMRKLVFWPIHDAICIVDDYLVQKQEAAGVLGLFLI